MSVQKGAVPDIARVREVLERMTQSLDDPALAHARSTLTNLLHALNSPLYAQLSNIQSSLTAIGALSHQRRVSPQEYDINPRSGQLLLHSPPNASIFDAGLSEGGPRGNGVAINNLRIGENFDVVSQNGVAVSVAGYENFKFPMGREEGQDGDAGGDGGDVGRGLDRLARGREMEVLTMFKPEGESFGFGVARSRSVEGNGEGGDPGIYVKEIQPGHVAAIDGRLRESDQILSINGHLLDAAISSRQAVEMLQAARGSVELIVAHSAPRAAPQASTSSPTSPCATPYPTVEQRETAGVAYSVSDSPNIAMNDDWLHVEVIDLVNDGSGLGFGIIGGKGAGVVVKTILKGGVSDRDGRLRSGDSILQIGDVDMRGMTSEQVAGVLRQLGVNVCLVVARHTGKPGGEPAGEAAVGAPRSPLNATIPGVGLEEHLASINRVLLERGAESSEEGEGGGSDTSSGVVADGQSEARSAQVFEVELTKDAQGLGITIAGYTDPTDGSPRIVVGGISEGSVAALDGRIQQNDQIIAVDNIMLEGYTNHEALDVLRNTGQVVRLKVVRTISTDSRPGFPPIGLPPAQTTPSKRLSPTTTQSTDPAHWQDMMGPDYTIVVATLQKFKEGGGLGIALAGTVDTVDGVDSLMHHCIETILPEGPVGVDGTLRSGDELLEVNGHRLLGLDHNRVVIILRELPLAVRLVCARRVTSRTLDYSAAVQTSLPPLSTGGEHTSPTPPTKADSRLVKARSENALSSPAPQHDEASLGPSLAGGRARARSLEPLDQLTLFEREPLIIELEKGERGLGFSILDYQDPIDASQSLIIIQSLVPGGVAQTDGRLVPGDRLVLVNGTSLQRATLEQAVQALQGAPRGVVKLGVLKPLSMSSEGGGEGEGGREVNGAASGVVRESPASEVDREISTNLLSSLTMTPLSLQDSPLHTPTPPHTPSHLNSNYHAPTHSSPTNAPLSQPSKFEPLTPLVVPSFTASPPSHRGVVAPSETKEVAKLLIIPPEGGWGPPRLVEVQRREGESLGISIVGGKVDVPSSTSVGSKAMKSLNGAVFINHVLPGSPANHSLLQQGDRILEVDGVDLRDATHDAVVEAIRRSTGLVRFLIQSRVDLSPSPPSSSAEIAEEEQAMFSGTQDEWGMLRLSIIMRKRLEPVRRKYDDLGGELHIVDLDQGSGGGLGLSLAGNKRLDFMSVFVIGIHPNSCTERQGSILIGDELLEVNEHVLYGRSHLNASAVIKSIKTPHVRVVLLRRQDYRDHVAVQLSPPIIGPKPQSDPLRPDFATNDKFQFGENMNESIAGASPQKTGQLSEIISLHKQGSQGLGFAIEEGRGGAGGESPGIFVKTITPDGLSARDGRLRVGDELTAVNGTALDRLSYQQALTVLRTIPSDSVVHLSVIRTKAGESSNPLLTSPPPPPPPTTSPPHTTPKKNALQSLVLSSMNPLSTPLNSAPLKSAPPPDAPPAIAPASPRQSDAEDPTTCPVVVGKETRIAIVKGKSGLGLSLVGGSDTLLGAVIIHEIYDGGAVARDGRLWAGDQILEVNGVDLRNATHDEAIQTLRLTPPTVRLTVLRGLDSLLSNDSSDLYDHIELTLMKQPGRGLGFSIVARLAEPSGGGAAGGGVFISELRTELSIMESLSAIDQMVGGVAEQDGRLASGDQILMINGEDVRTASQEYVATLLKMCKGAVSFRVSRLKFGTLTRHQKGAKGTNAANGGGEGGALGRGGRGVEEGARYVELTRSERGLLGVTLEGGRSASSGGENTPLVVASLQGAEEGGKLQERDRLLSINGQPTETLTPAGALSLIQSSPDPVRLQILRDAPRLEYLHDSRHQINKSNAAETQFRTADDSSDLGGQIKLIRLRKGTEGLGFTIVGGHASAHGDLPIYIKSVFTQGAAAKEGRLRRGDQLLAVDGRALDGMTHDEAVALLRDAQGEVVLRVLG